MAKKARRAEREAANAIKRTSPAFLRSRGAARQQHRLAHACNTLGRVMRAAPLQRGASAIGSLHRHQTKARQHRAAYTMRYALRTLHSRAPNLRPAPGTPRATHGTRHPALCRQARAEQPSFCYPRGLSFPPGVFCAARHRSRPRQAWLAVTLHPLSQAVQPLIRGGFRRPSTQCCSVSLCEPVFGALAHPSAGIPRPRGNGAPRGKRASRSQTPPGASRRLQPFGRGQIRKIFGPAKAQAAG